MEKFVERLLSGVGPLSVVSFIFAGVMLILGIAEGLKLPVLESIQPNNEFRVFSITLGILFFSFGIFTTYKPPKSRRSSNTDIPDELKKSFSARRNILGAKQERILDFLLEEATHGKRVNQSQVVNKFKDFYQISDAEMYYRLEQLRLLGFVGKEESGKHESGKKLYSYFISEPFAKDSGTN